MKWAIGGVPFSEEANKAWNELLKRNMSKELTELEKRIAQLEWFVSRVAEEGSDYWKDEAWKLLERHKASRIEELQQRVADLEKVLREIDQDPSQIILTDAQRKILEKDK